MRLAFSTVACVLPLLSTAVVPEAVEERLLDWESVVGEALPSMVHVVDPYRNVSAAGRMRRHRRCDTDSDKSQNKPGPCGSERGGSSAGQLISGSVPPVCTEEPFCAAAYAHQALCLDPKGEWQVVHKKMIQVFVAGTDLVGIDLEGNAFYHDISTGLPKSDDVWKALPTGSVFKQVCASAGKIYALDEAGRLLYRDAGSSPKNPWEDRSKGKTLNSISCWESDVFAIDSKGEPWRLQGGLAWKSISGAGCHSGLFLSVHSHRGHLFGVAIDPAGNPAGFYKNLNNETGEWAKISSKLSGKTINGGIVPSMCGGSASFPEGESYYAFAVSKEGKLFYKFSYALNPRGGKWYPLPLGATHKWRPLGVPAIADILGGQPHTLVANSKIGTLPSTYKYFKLTFEITPNNVVDKVGSIVSITSPQQVMHLPSVVLQKGTTVVEATVDSTSRQGVTCEASEPLPVGKKTEVTIEVSSGYFRIYYDGQIKCTQGFIEEVKTAPDAVMYASFVATNDWIPADAIIEDLMYDKGSAPLPVDMSCLTGGGDLVVAKGSKLGAVNLGTYFHMTMELTINDNMMGFHNLFHYTKNGNHGKEYSRTPAAWFHKGTMLHYRMGTHSNHNAGCDPRMALPLKKRFKLEMYFVPGPSSFLMLNGALICFAFAEGQPYSDEKLKGTEIWASDPWHPAAKATIHEWKYRELETDKIMDFLPEPVPVEKRFVALVDTYQYYWLSFTITPLGIESGWSNVLHITKKGGYGPFYRIPAVYFYPGTTRLHVRMGDASSHNRGCDPSDSLQIGREYTIKAQRSEAQIKVFIDGVEKCSVPAPRSTAYPAQQKVQLWVSDPWSPPAQANVSRVKYCKF